MGEMAQELKDTVKDFGITYKSLKVNGERSKTDEFLKLESVKYGLIVPGQRGFRISYICRVLLAKTKECMFKYHIMS